MYAWVVECDQLEICKRSFRRNEDSIVRWCSYDNDVYQPPTCPIRWIEKWSRAKILVFISSITHHSFKSILLPRFAVIEVLHWDLMKFQRNSQHRWGTNNHVKEYSPSATYWEPLTMLIERRVSILPSNQLALAIRCLLLRSFTRIEAT